MSLARPSSTSSSIASQVSRIGVFSGGGIRWVSRFASGKVRDELLTEVDLAIVTEPLGWVPVCRVDVFEGNGEVDQAKIIRGLVSANRETCRSVFAH